MVARRFLFKKGVVDVLLYLNKVESAGYYSLYRQNFVVSRQSFANILKELESLKLIKRSVIEGRPPRVKYGLTEKGKMVAALLEKLDEILRE